MRGSRKTGRLVADRHRRKSDRRASATRSERRILWIFTEGTVTEPEYFRDFKAAMRNTHTEIKIGSLGGSNPLDMVKESAKRSSPDPKRGDEVWCFFDVECPEKQPKFYEAIRHADKNNILLGISNPCFEVWLLLHHQENITYMTSKEAKYRYKKVQEHRFDYIGQANKAKQRAMQLTEGGSDGICDVNPSTNVWRVLDNFGPVLE